MPLRVIIAGAGIAGLACAIALGREGHTVDIYEKSAFSNEVGAAYHSGPYAVRIFKEWGLDIKAMRSVVVESWDYRDCLKPTEVESHYFVLEEKKREYGIDGGLDELMHHRVDAHRALRNHALAMPNVKLHLSAAAVKVDTDIGAITLSNGKVHTGDLVVGADGIHSKLVEAIDREATKRIPLGINMYRFMVPQKAARQDPELDRLLTSIKFPHKHVNFFEKATRRSLVLYSCRDGELINCATFQLAKDALVQLSEGDYTSPAKVGEVLHVMEGWPEAFKALARFGEDFKHWALINREIPKSCVKGRLALVGDAAHPTHPTHAAGANMGVEDAAVLGVLFGPNIRSKDVPDRLKLFHELRYLRTTTVKYASDMHNLDWQSFKNEIDAKIQARCGVGEVPDDMLKYLWTFDAVEDAKRAIANL